MTLSPDAFARRVRRVRSSLLRLLPADPAERWAAYAAAVASVFYALAAGWNAFAPLAAGHHAAMAASAIAGENIVRRHAFAFAPDYYSYAGPPHDADLFCHHPYGTAVLGALAYVFAGHHWVTARLPAIVCSALSGPLMYRLGRSIWGPIPAAVATVAFALVPIDLAFADYHALEVPTICFGLLLCWGTVRLWQTGRSSYLAAAAIGSFGACQCDWVGIVLTASLVAFGFVRAYVLPRRWVVIVDERQHARWFALLVASGVVTVVMYIVLFKKAGHLAEFLGSYDQRSAGTTSLDMFDHKRRLWLNWTLTPVGMGLVALSLPVSIARIVWARRSADFVTIAWTATATFQYVVFREAADFHIFWPQYFGVSIALGAATLACELLRLAKWLSAREPSLWARRLLFGGVAAILGIPLALLGRVGLPLLRLSLQTGGVILNRGRNDNHTKVVETVVDAAQFTAWAATLLPKDVPFVYGGFPDSRNVEYGAGRPCVRADRLQDARKPSAPDRFAVLDSRRVTLEDLRLIAHATSVQVVGPFWRIDRAGPGNQLVALHHEEREPGFFERYFVAGTDLLRTTTMEDDPWATWEWRVHLGLPAEVPSLTPSTLEEKRAAYNAAVLNGHVQDADALRAPLVAGTMAVPNVRIPGATLLGVAVEDGAATVATLIWEATDDGRGVPAPLLIRCRNVRRPWLWPTALDTFDYEIPTDFPLPRQAWHRGFVYAQQVNIVRRFGSDACVGESGGAQFPLFTLGRP